MAISDRDRKKLHDRAGGECSFADCRERRGLEEAHISGKEPGSPRYDPASRAAVDAYENRILLCSTHHHAVVDDLEESRNWSVERLLELRAKHEADVIRRMNESGEVFVVLGEPQLFESEYADKTHLIHDPSVIQSGVAPPPRVRVMKERVLYRLYRVPITSVGRDARDVFVQLAAIDPPLKAGLPSATLHLAGDNPADHVSFNLSRGFNLIRDTPRYVDVIAITKNPPFRCFIWSTASDDAMEEHQLNGRYVFRLGTVGGAGQDYLVEVDNLTGELSMSMMG